MNRNILSLALVFVTTLLGACAGTVKQLPDGGYAIMTTVGDTLDRSTSIVGEYNCPEDEAGKPIIGKCSIKAPKERVHGQTVAGQAIVGAVGGTGAALINGNTARSVARTGQCKEGANCGTVITNQVQSIAEALNDNKVKIGVSAGTAAACAATNTCGQ